MTTLSAFASLPAEPFEWLAREVPDDVGKQNTLRYYCEANFQIAAAQNLIYEDQARIFAVWRIGHLNGRDGRPLYAYFVKNRFDNRQKYHLLFILKGEFDGSLKVPYKDSTGHQETIVLKTPPGVPSYADRSPYQFNHLIEVEKWGHILDDHEERLKESLLQPTSDRRVLQLLIHGALYESHLRARFNLNIAIPQYYMPKKSVKETGNLRPQYLEGSYQYLLPLYITHTDFEGRPDSFAVLQEISNGGQGKHYLVKTVEPPWMAYSYARCITTDPARFRSWLEDITPPTRWSEQPIAPPVQHAMTDPRQPVINLSQVQTETARREALPANQAAAFNEDFFQEPPTLVLSISQNEQKKQCLKDGNAFYEQKDYRRAIEAYNKAIELDPKDRVGYYNKACALTAFEKYEAALEALTQLTDIDPNYGPAWDLAGQILKALGKSDEAEQAFQQARELGYNKRAE
jgi:tetratricopeptide (TPR) repeat protein